MVSVVAMSSCTYDDSNDIDIIMPKKDSTQGKVFDSDNIRA
ncbi:MAG: hypothetical protein WBM83_02390 [Flavobacteriaceae bacterium]